MKHGLTKRQHECLDFISGYIEKHGYSPSYADMLPAIGLKSKSGIARLVSALEERGHVVRLPHRARTLRLVE